MPERYVQQMMLVPRDKELPFIYHGHQIPELLHGRLVQTHQRTGGNVVQHKLAVIRCQQLGIAVHGPIDE